MSNINIFRTTQNTRIGPLLISVTDAGVYSIKFESTHPQIIFNTSNYSPIAPDEFSDFPKNIQLLFKKIVIQIDQYFLGLRKAFDIPIDWSGKTSFQQQVLKTTQKIPYGETFSYKQIAQQINHPNAARAVGNVEASNNIPIIIPCHRVIGSDGKLHGYSAPGGLKLKLWLLNFEKNNLSKSDNNSP